MKSRDVAFSPEAESDLTGLFDYIVTQAGQKVAQDYVARIETFCSGLDLASERGTSRDDLRKGLRVVGFEKRLTIAFMVEINRVVILKIFTAGQNWETAGW
jgi:toxin ParE1/3/4